MIRHYITIILIAATLTGCGQRNQSDDVMSKLQADCEGHNHKTQAERDACMANPDGCPVYKYYKHMQDEIHRRYPTEEDDPRFKQRRRR